MKNVSLRPLRRLAATLAVATGAALAMPAQADNYALIMWIGDYGDPTTNLPGIQRDAENARRIATAMNIPPDHVTELGNGALTKRSLSVALASAVDRMQKDDRLFIYFSGHGAQVPGVGGAACTEGIVTRDPALFEDFLLQDTLSLLGAKASQVVMMNDSCFAGGAATRALDLKGQVPKAFPKPIFGGGPGSGLACGQPANAVGRNLQAFGEKHGVQVLYIAAAAANEVSYATPIGSVATLAWASCLGADANRSGAVDGEELRSCSQNAINRAGGRQTITLVGNTHLPLYFIDAGAGTAQDPAHAASASPLDTLQDIRNGRDASHAVTLTPALRTMRIGQDALGFSVKTARAGYLYVLQVGSDGKNFNVLFPNRNDDSNFFSPGSYDFPHDNWRIRATGPAGTSYLLAIVSPTRKDLSKGMNLSGVFATHAATAAQARNLVAEAAGGSNGGGRYGASSVVSIREVN